MHRVGPFQARLARRGRGAQQARDIAGGNANGPQAGNHDLRVILTHPAPGPERVPTPYEVDKALQPELLKASNGGEESNLSGRTFSPNNPAREQAYAQFRTLRDLLVDDATLAARRAKLTPYEIPAETRGYARLLLETVEQADRGCDFAFMAPHKVDRKI